MEHNSNTQELSAGERKIQEYVDRIVNGADREEVMKELPKLFRDKIEEKLEQLRKQEIAKEQTARLVAESVEPIDEIKERQKKREVIEQAMIATLQRSLRDGEHLREKMWRVSKGVLENEDPDDEEVRVYDRVSGEIGEQYDAHGLSKSDQLGNLLNILDQGIDPKKTFYTAPFEIPDEKRAALGSALGTAGGTAYKDGIAVLVGPKNGKLVENGIHYVFINDACRDILEPLKNAYPNHRFYLLSEQKRILEAKE